MIDLNTLILAGSGAVLYEADNLNERGEIVASGLPAGCNDRFSCGHIFLLIPCDDDHPGVEGCDYTMVDATEVENNVAVPQYPQAIPPTMYSVERTINPSQNWFRQRYRMLGQRPPLRH